MKIRNGFVSNSSTSSFAVYGFLIDSEKEMYEKLLNKKTTTITNGCSHEFDRSDTGAKFCPSCGSPKKVSVELREYEIYNALEEYFEKKNLDIVRGSSDEGGEADLRFLGISLSSKVTLVQLAKAESLLKELFPDKTSEFHYGSYYS